MSERCLLSDAVCGSGIVSTISATETRQSEVILGPAGAGCGVRGVDRHNTLCDIGLGRFCLDGLHAWRRLNSGSVLVAVEWHKKAQNSAT
jgi:hypothetical protein